MKKLITLAGAFFALSISAYSQSALQQLEAISGISLGSVSVPPPSGPVPVGPDYSSSSNNSSSTTSNTTTTSSPGSYNYSNSNNYNYNSSNSYEFNEVRSSWASRRDARREARRSARDSRRSSRSSTTGSRTSSSSRRSSSSSSSSSSSTRSTRLRDYEPMKERRGNYDAGNGQAGDVGVIKHVDNKGRVTYGLKNSANGRWIRKPRYEGLNIVSLQAAQAKIDGKWGIINSSTGDTVEEFKYDKSHCFYNSSSTSNMVIALGQTDPFGHEQWILVSSVPGQDGVYKRSKEVFSSVDYFYDGGGARIICRPVGGKIEMLDGFGRQILPASFESLKYLDFTVDGDSYYAGSIDVRGFEKQGIVDDKGRVVVPFVFDKVESGSDVRMSKYGFVVHKDGLQGLYSVDGAPLLPPAYSKVEVNYGYTGGTNKAYIKVYKSDGTQAIFSTAGEQLTPFDSVALLSDVPDPSVLEDYRIY